MMGDHDVTLAEQLACALDADACFCIACGQPDEPSLHDPARCRARGGENDRFTVADAVEIFDASCEQEPDLDDDARALHCSMLAAAPKAPTPIEGGEAEARAKVLPLVIAIHKQYGMYGCDIDRCKIATDQIIAALASLPKGDGR